MSKNKNNVSKMASMYTVFRAGTVINAYVTESKIMKKHGITPEQVFTKSLGFLGGIVAACLATTLDFHVKSGGEILGGDSEHPVKGSGLTIFTDVSRDMSVSISYKPSTENMLAVIDALTINHLVGIERHLESKRSLSDFTMFNDKSCGLLLTLPVGMFFSSYYSKGALIASGTDRAGIGFDCKIDMLSRSDGAKGHVDVLFKRLKNAGLLEDKDPKRAVLGIKWGKLTAHIIDQLKEKHTFDSMLNRMLKSEGLLPTAKRGGISDKDMHFDEETASLLIRDISSEIRLPAGKIHDGGEIDELMRQCAYSFGVDLVRRTSVQSMLVLLRTLANTILHRCYLLAKEDLEIASKILPADIIDNVARALSRGDVSIASTIDRAIEDYSNSENNHSLLTDCLNPNIQLGRDHRIAQASEMIEGLIGTELGLKAGPLFRLIMDRKNDVDISDVREVVSTLSAIHDQPDSDNPESSKSSESSESPESPVIEKAEAKKEGYN